VIADENGSAALNVLDAPTNIYRPRSHFPTARGLANVPRFSCADHAEVSPAGLGEQDRGPCERRSHLGREP
jgi:hypothetical protein